ncbi:MAG: ThuA domain-containing protein [Verrucomicrobiaceae bacterium]|nr:ThuA domain-containing protein [Verrucomicrobiaceae bacterium]
MKTCLVALLVFFACADDGHSSNIVIMAVEEPDNYDAVNSMNCFAESELRPAGHQVTVVVGDRPTKHHFEGLVSALRDADLLILFSRRRFLPKEQMQAVRAHLNAGKPLLGIRTANHAFIPRPKDVVEAGLTTWPEFTEEVLGGQNTGYETKGLPYLVSKADDAESALLKGVNTANIRGHQSLYKVLPLAADAKPLLIGTAKAGSSTEPQPVAWTRHYGPKNAPIFYTSLGAPEDMKISDVRQLLTNAVTWCLK